MRKLLLCLCFALPAFGAVAQSRDCGTIKNPQERLKCFDRQSGSKAQPAAPAAAAPAATPAPAPEPFVPAFTVQILRTEPPIGQLPPGAKVLIDDGTCPGGQLKQVVGGNVTTGQARLRSCVPRPAAPAAAAPALAPTAAPAAASAAPASPTAATQAAPTPASPAAAAAPTPEPFAPAFTAQILKTEPPIGQLPPGAKVLIDDGTCPVGQLKQVVGGNTATGQARLRSCVPLP